MRDILLRELSATPANQNIKKRLIFICFIFNFDQHGKAIHFVLKNISHSDIY